MNENKYLVITDFVAGESEDSPINAKVIAKTDTLKKAVGISLREARGIANIYKLIDWEIEEK